jgi:hypothetical protein
MSANERRMAHYPVPENARCGQCGGVELSPVPKFFAGVGTSFAPFNEAVLCRKCGHIGAFALTEVEREDN